METKENRMEREKFSSRLGFILISAGCAIGLGNVWRFPYIVGEYGVTVQRIVDEEGNEQESAPHPKQVLYVDLSGKADRYDILRRAEE